MAIAETTELPFYLRGNFAPIMDEATAFDLPCDGAIPPELRGLYLRNGPNPKAGDPGHWFAGDGMVHGVRLERGRAVWFRNRWVRTRAFVEGAELVDANGNVDHSVGVANTNIFGHAGRLFALVESSWPTEMTRELDTIGPCDFGGRLTTSMTAHPKLDPVTGALHFFGYRFLPPYLTYHRLDAAGTLVQSAVIDVRGPAMIHDFAITERHIIFMDLPIVFNFERAMRRHGFPYEWSDDYGARLGVMPHGGGSADVRWFETAPCYVFHPLNAFEDGDRIVLDVARYDELWRGGPDTFSPAFLHRWTIDLSAGTVGERRLDDRPIEFPRVDDRRAGRRHRYGYAVTNAANVGEQAMQLVKYDLATGAATAHDFGPGCMPAEGAFVPAGGSAGEDEGYVLLYVYDAARNASDLVILDAARFAGRPVATIHLPQRVPFGFHGNWIAEAA
ncbi:MAG TPA: carotenoid oxygenase family protein [Candidatus Acidoferrales bacterium]|nr:carotenoid oxygenase family protein [Candidatus Acidoferrales bacterium]